MYSAVRAAQLGDKNLIFLDEAVFTFNTFSTRAWSAKNSRIEVQDLPSQFKTQALVAAVSADGELEGYLLNPKSITTKEFVTFVEQLSAKYGGAELSLFMDNLRVHRSHLVVETCKRLKIQQIFNPQNPDPYVSGC